MEWGMVGDSVSKDKVQAPTTTTIVVMTKHQFSSCLSNKRASYLIADKTLEKIWFMNSQLVLPWLLPLLLVLSAPLLLYSIGKQQVCHRSRLRRGWWLNSCHQLSILDFLIGLHIEGWTFGSFKNKYYSGTKIEFAKVLSSLKINIIVKFMLKTSEFIGSPQVAPVCSQVLHIVAYIDSVLVQVL